jgi:hypothetical protein
MHTGYLMQLPLVVVYETRRSRLKGPSCLIRRLGTTAQSLERHHCLLLVNELIGY